MDEGQLLPHALLPDVPTMINGFVPRNFTRQYDGAVRADEALVRSLASGAVPADEFISATFDLDQSADAFAASANPENVKVVVTVGGRS